MLTTKQTKELLAQFNESIESTEDWGGYASDYMKTKHKFKEGQDELKKQFHKYADINESQE